MLTVERTERHRRSGSRRAIDGQLRLFEPDDHARGRSADLMAPLVVPWRSRRFDVAPIGTIAESFGWSKNTLVHRLGTNKRQWDHAVAVGVTGHTADRWACRLGLHPTQLWPHWLDDT